MSSLSIRLSYRPLRIGWCVERGDWDGLRNAMRWSFVFWGGRYNPIIPIDDIKLARRLADVFRVDALYPATITDRVTQYIDANPHLPWFGFHRQLVENHGSFGRFSAVADIMEPMSRIFDARHRSNSHAHSVLALVDWDEDDPLRDIFAATFGTLPPASETAEDYRAYMALHLGGMPNRIAKGAAIPPLPPGQLTIASLNRQFLEIHYANYGSWRHPGFYLGDAGNFDDVLSYWNLRATAFPLLFVDPAHIDRFDSFRDAMATTILEPPPPGMTLRYDKLEGASIWHRPEIDISPLRGWVEGALDCTVSADIWNGLNVDGALPEFGRDTALASIDNSREPPSISFALPNPPIKFSTYGGDQKYVVSVDPGIGLFGNERHTLHLPHIPALNPFYSRELRSGISDVRSEQGTIGLIVSSTDNHCSFSAIDNTELVAQIFLAAGIKAAPSAAGLVCSRLITQMGGIDKCRVFRIGGVRKLIEDHRPDESFTRSQAKQTILGAGTDHALETYQSLYIEPRKPGSGLTNDAVLAHLLNKGIFRPGLKLGCPSCGLDFWRSVDDVATRTECEYCGHGFNIGPQLKDRDWAFRRSGLFGRNDHQQGAIPVALVLQQLSHICRRADPIYTTALTLTPHGADIATCETDFVFVASGGREGRTQIAIGECKTRQSISEQDVSNLLRVAEAFPEDRFDVFLVFAKLDDFSEEEVRHTQVANDQYRKRAILLTARELEPWDIYERSNDIFDVRRHAISLRELADATEAIFFEKRLKMGQDEAGVNRGSVGGQV